MNAELHELQTHDSEEVSHRAEEHDDSLSARVRNYIETYGPYLTDLWVRLYKTTILFCVVFAGGFFVAEPILKVFLKLFSIPGVTIVATTPFQFVDLSVDVAFFFAILISIPYFTWQVCAFVKPAVSPKEYRSFVLLLPVSLILFAIGFAYAFGVLFVSLRAMAVLNLDIGLKNYWDISAYVSAVIMTATLLGVLFQFPIIVTLLIRFGMISRNFLVKHRRGAYAAIAILVGLLPPNDVLSLFILALPLVLLYEVTILVNRPKVLISRPHLHN